MGGVPRERRPVRGSAGDCADGRGVWYTRCHRDGRIGFFCEVPSVIELIRQYLAITRKGTHTPSDEAELERIYMDVLRRTRIIGSSASTRWRRTA